MEVFVVLGVLVVIFIILGAVISYRARKRAEVVGTPYDEIRAQKAEQKARREEGGDGGGDHWI